MGELRWKGSKDGEGDGNGVWWIKQTVSLAGFWVSLRYGSLVYDAIYDIELETISDLLNLPPILLSPYRQLMHVVSLPGDVLYI